MTKAERIARERTIYNPRPWEFVPSEVFGEVCGYPPGSAGHASWQRCLDLCAEIVERDPAYFRG